MGLFNGLFKKGRALPSQQLELDPFSFAVPLIRTMISGVVLSVGTNWSVGYFEAASSAVTYYTLYFVCSQQGEGACDSFSSWLENPWSLGVHWELTDAGNEIYTKGAITIPMYWSKPVPYTNMSICEVQASLAHPDMLNYTNNGLHLSEYVCNSENAIKVAPNNLQIFFSPGDSYTAEKYFSKGELASSSLVSHIYKSWLKRKTELHEFLMCNPHEYLNESQLLANSKICFDLDTMKAMAFEDGAMIDINVERRYEDELIFPFPHSNLDWSKSLDIIDVSEKQFLDSFVKLDWWRTLMSIGVYIRYVYVYYLIAWIVSPIGPFDLGYRALVDKDRIRERQTKVNEILNDIGGRK